MVTISKRLHNFVSSSCLGQVRSAIRFYFPNLSFNFSMITSDLLCTKVMRADKPNSTQIWVKITICRWLGKNRDNGWCHLDKLIFHLEEKYWNPLENIDCWSYCYSFQLYRHNDHFFCRIHLDYWRKWRNYCWIRLSWNRWYSLGFSQLVSDWRCWNFTSLCSGFFFYHVLLCFSSFGFPSDDEFEKTNQKEDQYYIQ